MKTRLPLLAASVAAVCFLASCLGPETFTAKLRITKDYRYVFEYDGTVAVGPAIWEIAEKGKLDPTTEATLLLMTTEFKKEHGWESASYKGNGRWKVKFKQEGVVTNRHYFFDDASKVASLYRQQDGSILFSGTEVKAEDIAQLKTLKFKMDGTLEVLTDCAVASQNATETGAIKDGLASYTWKITSDNLSSPRMLLQTGAPPPVESAALAAASVTPATTSAAPIATTAPPAPPAPTRSSGQYQVALNDSGKTTALQPIPVDLRNTLVNGRKTKVAYFSGPTAAARTGNTKPGIQVAIPSNKKAEKFITLDRLATDEKDRFVQAVQVNVRTGKGGEQATTTVSLDFEAVPGSADTPKGFTTYKVTPKTPLSAGEYILQVMLAECFDFGVDQK